MSDTRDNLHSSYREGILEHVFVGELLRCLWIKGLSEVEVLKPEVDAAGYDLAIECGKHLRHIQLKSSFMNATTQKVLVNTRLELKPSGCVVWVCFNRQTLQPGPYHWIGCAPGEPLPDLGIYPLARQVRRNAAGIKPVRPRVRVVPKTAFTYLSSIEEVAERLFGAQGR